MESRKQNLDSVLQWILKPKIPKAANSKVDTHQPNTNIAPVVVGFVLLGGLHLPFTKLNTLCVLYVIADSRRLGLVSNLKSEFFQRHGHYE